MRRRVAAAAAVAALLLTGCAPQYATPDERSGSFAEPVAEKVKELDPQPDEVRVRSGFDGITVEAYLDDMSYSDTREFIEGVLPIVEDSPLGAMPVRLLLGHAKEGQDTASGTLEWLGYDPARSDRYFAAVEVWLDILADAGVQFDDRFQVQAAYVFGEIRVLDGRDIDAYSAEVIAKLEQAGYVEPSIVFTPVPTP